MEQEALTRQERRGAGQVHRSDWKPFLFQYGERIGACDTPLWACLHSIRFATEKPHSSLNHRERSFQSTAVASSLSSPSPLRSTAGNPGKPLLHFPSTAPHFLFFQNGVAFFDHVLYGSASQVFSLVRQRQVADTSFRLLEDY